MCLEHPPSRGAVHITPSDPTKLPETGPGYFCNEVDSDILAVGIRGLIGDEIISLKQTLQGAMLGSGVTLTDADNLTVLRQHLIFG